MSKSNETQPTQGTTPSESYLKYIENYEKPRLPPPFKIYLVICLVVYFFMISSNIGGLSEGKASLFELSYFTVLFITAIGLFIKQKWAWWIAVCSYAIDSLNLQYY